MEKKANGHKTYAVLVRFNYSGAVVQPLNVTAWTIPPGSISEKQRNLKTGKTLPQRVLRKII